VEMYSRTTSSSVKAASTEKQNHKIAQQKKIKVTSAVPNFAAKNCLVVNTKLRGELRRLRVEDIREEVARISSVVDQSLEEKRKRVDGLVRETNEAVDGMEQFLDETNAEYNSMLERFSPPEEKSIDEIVEKMEEEFRSVFDIYKSEMIFDVGSTRGSMVEGGDEEVFSSRSGASSDCTGLTGASDRRPVKMSWKMMEEDVKRIKTRCEANIALEMELTEKIARENQAIEKENMKNAAARHEEAEEMHENEKKIERLRREIQELESPLPEHDQITTLTGEIEELKEERRKIERQIEEVEERTRHARSRSEKTSRPSRD
ncbi:hypothetical protein PRIPAC_94685, partial [Pristionchus pacificus]